MAKVRITPTGYSVKTTFELTTDLTLLGESLYDAATQVVGAPGKLMFRGKLISRGEVLGSQGVKAGSMLIMIKTEAEGARESPVKKPTTLTNLEKLEEMGYDRATAEQALQAVAGQPNTVAAAVDWLLQPRFEPLPPVHPDPLPPVQQISEPVPKTDAPSKLQPQIIEAPPKVQEQFTEIDFSEDNASAVYAWGYGEFGQLGTGGIINEVVPVNVSGMKGLNVMEISCGSLHSVALTQEGRVYEWGRYYYPILKEPTEDDQGPPQPFFLPPSARQTRPKPVMKYGDNKIPRLVDSLAHIEIAHIAAGGVHTLALDSFGILWTWGEGLAGQLGHGEKQNERYPRVVDALKHSFIVQVAAGSKHSVCVSANGSVFSWGDNRAGQLGTGDFEERLSPRYVFVGLSEEDSLLKDITPDRVSRVQCGVWHTIAETRSPQALYVWGSSSFNHERLSQFSDKHMQPRLIASGSRVTLILTVNGELYSVQEPDEEERGSRCVTRIEDFHNKRINGIYCGATYMICLAEDGSAYARGENKKGQLGLGDLKNRVTITQPEFTVVTRLSDFQISAIACGNTHCIAVVREQGLAADMRQALKDEILPDSEVWVSDIQSKDRLRVVKVNKLLLQAHMTTREAGLEETTQGFVADLSQESLDDFLSFLYSGQLPKVILDPELRRRVINELRTYARMKNLKTLETLCVLQEAVPVLDQAAQTLRILAIDEISKRMAVHTVPEPEAMEVEETKEENAEEKRQQVQEALNRMREMKAAAEEKRQRMLQALAQREEVPEQTQEEQLRVTNAAAEEKRQRILERLAQREEVQEQMQDEPMRGNQIQRPSPEAVMRDAPVQNPDSEAARREKRAKMLQALENRK